MLPSNTDITYFIEVARSKNLSRASERLGVAQPSLSVSMRRLEDAIGTDLLIRSKSGVQLTRAGHRLLRQSHDLLKMWQALQSNVAKEENELSGTYSIGCHTSVALYTLPHFMADLVKNNPQLELNLHHDLSSKITADVINFKLDFGIVINPVRHPDLVIKSICDDVVSLWTTDKNKNESVLISDANLAQTQDILKKLNKGTKIFTRHIYSPDLEVVCSLTAAGVGCGIIPSRVAQRLKSNHLKPLAGSWPKFHDKVCLVFRADTQKSVASKGLAKFIVQKISKTLA